MSKGCLNPAASEISTQVSNLASRAATDPCVYALSSKSCLAACLREESEAIWRAKDLDPLEYVATAVWSFRVGAFAELLEDGVATAVLAVLAVTAPSRDAGPSANGGS